MRHTSAPERLRAEILRRLGALEADDDADGDADADAAEAEEAADEGSGGFDEAE